MVISVIIYWYKPLIFNWLRVFRSVDASRIGEGERQQGHTKAVRSKKCGAFRGTTAARGLDHRVGHFRPLRIIA